MKSEIEARLLECDVKHILKKLKETGASFVGDWLQIRNCYDFNPVKENSWIPVGSQHGAAGQEPGI